MKKARTYLWTLLGLSGVVLLVSLLTINYLFSTSRTRLLELQLEASKREAREIEKLLEQQLDSGLSSEQVAHNLQQSIENTDTQTGFVCMYDTTGKEICHPDPGRIGQKIDKKNSVVGSITGGEAQSFYELLNQGKATGGMRTFGADRAGSEIIYVSPVSGTDWMVAAHANLRAVNRQVGEMHTQFLLAQGIAATLIVMLSFLVVRRIGNRYEKQLEQENSQLAEEVRSLSNLNVSLLSYQQKVESQSSDSEESVVKQRIMTYWKDEIIPIAVDQIAYFYTQQSQTYIYCRDERVYTSTASLDELQKQLNGMEFFRANRQFILSIRAIDNIYLYGKNQLKIAVHPTAPENILISKNKVGEFKQWLNS